MGRNLLMLGASNSFFGTQEGDFSLTQRSIEAVTVDKDGTDGLSLLENEEETGHKADHDSDDDAEESIFKGSSGQEGMDPQVQQRQSWMHWIWGRCWKL
jgi:hypothetical protein